METEEHGIRDSESVGEPIHFGSTITISINEEEDKFVFAKGFLSNKIYIRSVLDLNESNSTNFNNCTFKILPFSSASSSKGQTQILSEIVKNKDYFLKSNITSKRNKIADLKNRLGVELNSSINIYKKLIGTPVLFQNSSFQLLHCASLKYVSLNNDDENFLYFELVDYPNENSFFKFIPCLKLQKERNNQVFNQDLLFIYSTKAIGNKHPSMYVSHGSMRDSRKMIMGNIESGFIWRVNRFQSYETEEKQDYLFSGKSISLYLSEKAHFLSAKQKSDFFKEKLSEITERYLGKQNSENSGFSFKEEESELQINETRNFSVKPSYLNFDKKESNVSVTVRKESANQATERISQKYRVLFYKENLGIREKSHEEMRIGRLWVVEDLSTIKGGMLAWNQPIKLRHFSSGKYLSVKEISQLSYSEENIEPEKPRPNSEYILTLAEYFCPLTYFRFVALKRKNYNSSSNDENFIFKDSFFKIQHCQTKQWLAFNEDFKPCLSVTPKDNFTFKIVNCDFEEIWENTFLINVRDHLVQNIRIIEREIQNQKMGKMAFKKITKCIKLLQHFVENSLSSFISDNMAYAEVSYTRQISCFEEGLISILLWFIAKFYPQSLKANNEPPSPLLGNKYTFKEFSRFHLYTIFGKICKLLQKLCFMNSKIQEFMYENLAMLVNFIGTSEFITETIKTVFRNNENLLKKLSIGKENETMLFLIMSNLLNFEPYSKPSILRLLSSTCVNGNKSVFENQDEIFKVLSENEEIRDNCLIKISAKDTFYLSLGIEGETSPVPLIEIIKEEESESWLMEYLIVQLELISSICFNRNYMSCKTFIDVYPMQLLLKYTLDNSIPERLRASFLKLLKVLYIDKDPRIKVKKPELVRLVRDIPASSSGKSHNLFVFPRLKEQLLRTQTFISSKMKLNSLRKKKSKASINLEFSDFGHRSSIREFDDTILLRNKSDDNEEMQLLADFRHEIFYYLKSIYHLGIKKRNYDLISNELTLEVIRSFNFLLKFDLVKTRINTSIKTIDPDFRKMVKYLSKILELDKDYYKAIQEKGIIFKHEEFSKTKKLNHKITMKYVVRDLKKSIKHFSTLLIKKDSRIQEENSGEIFNNENNVIKENIFKKIQGLNRILAKFTNKTFTINLEKGEISHIVQIKVEICEIFNFLLDIREDFYIDNLFTFFDSVFLEKAKSLKQSQIHETPENFEELFSTILPPKLTEAGKTLPKSESFKNYFSNENEIDIFDEIIGKPFMETLLLGFYFAEEPLLQNSLINLVKRFSTQRQKLFENMNKVEILINNPQQFTFQVYLALRKLLGKISSFVAINQVWMNLKESLQNSRNEEIMDKVINKLRKVRNLFSKHCDDLNMMKTKQNIFRNFEGANFLFVLIEASIKVLTSNYQEIDKHESGSSDSFQLDEEDQIQDIIEKIANIVRISIQVLIFYVSNYEEGQFEVVERLSILFFNNVEVNLGQISLLTSCYENNVTLINELGDKELNYVIDMIKCHGRYPEFLEFFETLISDCKQDQVLVEIQKKILKILTDEDNFQTIFPILKNTEELQENQNIDKKLEDSYKEKLILLLSKCINGNLPVNLISLLYSKISMKELLLVLIEKSNLILKADKFEIIDNKTLDLCKCILKIFKVFILQSESTFMSIVENGKLFSEFLEIMQMIVTSKEIISLELQEFVVIEILNLILPYSDLFLKEYGMLLGMNAFEINLESMLRRKIYEFVENLSISFRRFNGEFIQSSSEARKNLRNFEDRFGLPALYIDNSNLPSRMKSPDSSFVNNEIFTSLRREETSMFGRLRSKLARTVTFHNSTPQRSDYNLIAPDENTLIQRASHEELWELFQEMTSKSLKIKEECKTERYVLANSIKSFTSIYVIPKNEEDKELLISCEDLVMKFLGYIEYWKKRRAPKQCLIYVMKILTDILENSEKEEEMVEHQNLCDQLQGTKILMYIFSNANEVDLDFQYSSLKLFTSLLNGGNPNVQKTLHETFMSNSNSENFFKRINFIISEATKANTRSKGKLQMKILEKLLRLLQLFCEGHNLQMQYYLQYQRNSKNSYDLVTLISKFLLSLKISDSSYGIVCQCFDSLTEFIQGPCKNNQKILASSKFLEYALSLLSENPKIFENDHKEVSNRKIWSFAEENHKKVQFQFKDEREVNKEKSDNNIHKGRLSRLQYKCLITIVSLLECNSKSDNILNRIRRGLPLSLLKNNLVSYYSQFKLYFNGEYSENCLMLMDTPINEDDPPEKYEFIMEKCFLTYILFVYLIENTKELEVSEEGDEEITEIMEEMSKGMEKSNILKDNIIGDVSKLSTSLLSYGLGLMKSAKRKMRTVLMNSTQEEVEEFEKIQKDVEEKQISREALNFFQKIVVHIEVIRENKIQKIYFPILPFCRSLPKSVKRDIHEKVNRSSIKSKLNDLMLMSDYVIKVMKHEEKLKNIFNRNKTLGAIASHGKLWERGSLYTSIIINFIILLSYSDLLVPENETDSEVIKRLRNDEPRIFFQKRYYNTLLAIQILGIFNIFFTGLVVFFFLFKRAPFLVDHIWENFQEICHKRGVFRIFMSFIKRVILSIIIFMFDLIFVYYIAFITIAIVGVTIHPFFFVLHILDFLRTEVLKNVAKAIYLPKAQLFLTFILLNLIVYIFALIGYSAFHDHYNGYCETLWRCFLVTFDYTFKETGSIGGYLKEPGELAKKGDNYIGVPHSPFNVYIGRFFFDNINYTILALIILNMIAGIIIDTFGSLKDSLAAKLSDQKQECFICGIKRDILDRAGDSTHGLLHHIKKDHYMWNYIFYKAYLEWKEKTEYNGNESYIYDKIKNFDLNWFPIKRCLAINYEDNDENEELKHLDEIDNSIADLNKKIEKLNEKAEKLLDSNLLYPQLMQTPR